jgi:hypothetical protein
MMEKFQKLSNLGNYTPLPDPFRINVNKFPSSIKCRISELGVNFTTKYIMMAI